MQDKIRIQGARENNLKNIDLEIPKHRLVVVTGPSGSGKSTLVLDILQKECQRQYMESSGMAAEVIEKPQVDAMSGLSPSISVGQYITNRNPRSTVGTMTDMHTYLRLVFQKKGVRTCRACHTAIHPPRTGGEEASVLCPKCGQEHPALTKADFSFNTPQGACSTCSGLGTVVEIDVDAVFDRSKSIRDGAVTFWYSMVNDYSIDILKAAGHHYGLDMNGDRPLHEYDQVQWDLLMYGVESEQFSCHFPDTAPPKTVGKGKFEGVLTAMWRRYKEKGGQSGEAAYFHSQTCPDCDGDKLRKEIRQVTVEGRSLPELSKCSLEELHDWLDALQAKYRHAGDTLFDAVLHDLLVKLERIVRVGLGYLTLDRQFITLSGGEAQRLRLASILGSGLTGVLYLLDEPTLGLHPKDTDGLVHIMKALRDLGNTVLVIEHDLHVIQEADHVIDIGPGAGRFGGEVVGQGSFKELGQQERSVTGAYWNQPIRLPSKLRKGNGKQLTIDNANLHNLQNISVSIPLGCLVAVSGVSGSGKSTLVFDLLASSVSSAIAARTASGAFSDTISDIDGCSQMTGLHAIQSIISIGQSPVSRMQRSVVSTYVDLFTYLRKVFAGLPESKRKGLKEKHFSFNTTGGRCDRCEGLGQVEVDMHFLSHLTVTCPDCQGKRFKPEILAVTYRGYTITDFLEMTIEESLPLFAEVKKLKGLLALLCDVGLGYLQWGQSLTTLSGGEAQRLRLAKELSTSTSGHTLYLLDEPSTGLHLVDIEKLYALLSKLVESGHTVIMVEHHTELIAAADWVIDLGPGGGQEGGRLVASGTPHELAQAAESYTGRFLKSVLQL